EPVELCERILFFGAAVLKNLGVGGGLQSLTTQEDLDIAPGFGRQVLHFFIIPAGSGQAAAEAVNKPGDLLFTAVADFQRFAFPAKDPVETGKEFLFAPAPAVDGLLFIANGNYPDIPLQQRLEDLPLEDAGILEFVDEEGFHFGAQQFKEVGADLPAFHQPQVFLVEVKISVIAYIRMTELFGL